LSDDLDHLTEEEKKTVLSIFPKEIRDLESTDDGEIAGKPVTDNIEPKVDNSKKETDEKYQDDEPEKDADWKEGYLDYAKKSKDSDRVSYEDSEIEIIEEDM